MLLKAVDLALCIRITRSADIWLMHRGDPFVAKRCESLAYDLRRKLIQRIAHEDPAVLKLGAFLAGGAGEYTPLIRRVEELHG